MQATARRRPRQWTADDDAHLDAILALAEVWRARHGHVTLADLELDPRLATFVVAGMCAKHGQFVKEWTGRIGEEIPLEVCCPGDRGHCAEIVPVFVLV